ncbi:MAG: RDD family protein [Thiolinea sp.]
MIGRSEALKAGELILNYEIQSYLGEGGFSIVYKAINLGDVTGDVAKHLIIKEYFPSHLAPKRDSKTNKLFVSEYKKKEYERGLYAIIENSKNLKNLINNSKSIINIVKIVHCFELNNTAYIVMEANKGDILQKILSERKILSYSEIINFFIPVLDGLRFLHKNNIFHLDIKPSNIFISYEQPPIHYLIDFGSAYFSEYSNKISTKHASKTFSPPEFYDDANNFGDSKSDVYALGATLYKCIGGNLVAADSRQKEKDTLIPATSGFYGKYPQGLLILIDQCLALDPTTRLKDAEEVQNRLIALHNEEILKQTKEELVGKNIGHASLSPNKKLEIQSNKLAVNAILDESYYAGFMLRLLAFMVDCYFLVTPVVLIVLILPSNVFVDFSFGLILFSNLFLLGWLYFGLVDGSLVGATLGKRVFNIRVINEHGKKLGFLVASWRYFLKIIFFMLFFFNIKYKKRNIHDLVVNTFVISKV